MSTKRNYRYSNVHMCLAALIITESFNQNLSALSDIRTNWTPEYAANLKVKIEEAVKKYLGIDPKKGLRDASRMLFALMEPAKDDLSMFKVQLKGDFKEEKEKIQEILTNLGITKNHREVQKNNQEALIDLLFAFQLNMTEPLKADISSKGMNPVLIDRISGYTLNINNANINQEGLKETTKEITDESTIALNAIYDEVIKICKIAVKRFKNEPLKKEQFTFSKVVANMSPTKKPVETPEY